MRNNIAALVLKDTLYKNQTTLAINRDEFVIYNVLHYLSCVHTLQSCDLIINLKTRQGMRVLNHQVPGLEMLVGRLLSHEGQ